MHWQAILQNNRIVGYHKGNKLFVVPFYSAYPDLAVTWVKLYRFNNREKELGRAPYPEMLIEEQVSISTNI